MDTIKILEIQLSKLEKAIAKLKKSILMAPQGNVVCRKTRGITRFFKVNTKQSTEYLGMDKVDAIRALAQKRYDNTLLEALKEEEDILSDAFIRLSKSKSRKKLEKFPNELKPYVRLDSFTDESYIQNWIDSFKHYPSPEYSKYKEPFQTRKGEIVNSKSEVIIADRLYALGIHYHYEKPLELNEGATHRKPDFTILHPYTLETYYWEHFGLMDNEEYRNQAKAKIELYALNGIIQGKNFMTTFETSLSPLNIWYVDKLINEYFKTKD